MLLLVGDAAEPRGERLRYLVMKIQRAFALHFGRMRREHRDDAGALKQALHAGAAHAA